MDVWGNKELADLFTKLPNSRYAKILFGTPPPPLAFATRSHTEGSGGASPLCALLARWREGI